MRKYILAFSYHQARDYMQLNGLSPIRNTYISRVEQLKGMNLLGEQVIYVPGWEENPAYDSEFLKELEYRLLRGKAHRRDR